MRENKRKIKPKHTIYYKNIDKLTTEDDIFSSKFIYKVLKEAGYFK